MSRRSIATLVLLTLGCRGGMAEEGETGSESEESATDGDSSSSSSSTTDDESATDGTSSEATSESTDESTETGEPSGRLFVYVGGYAGTISWAEIDPASGEPSGEGSVGSGSNPSYVAANPAATHLYAVDEVGDFEGNPTGSVAAYEIDAGDGSLVLLNRVASAGRGPAHVATDGSWVFVANYTEGTVAVLPVLGDGSLGDAVDVEDRGDGAQAHMVALSPDGAHVFVPFKGLDLVAQFDFDPRTGMLEPNAVPDVPTADGRAT